jgi:hypothetical protein
VLEFCFFVHGAGFAGAVVGGGMGAWGQLVLQGIAYWIRSLVFYIFF